MDSTATQGLEAALQFKAKQVTAKAFFWCQHKYTQFFGGVRNGKSHAASAKVLFLCLIWPGNVALVGRDTLVNLQDSTMKVFFKIVEILNGAPADQPGKIVRKFDKTRGQQTLFLNNGSEIRFRYLTKMENIQGSEYGVVYVDEVDQVPEETYDMLESRLSLWHRAARDAFKFKHRDHVVATLGKYIPPRPFIFVTGNPAPTWVKRRFKDPEKSPKYHLFEASTEENVENLGQSYIDDLRATHDSDWCKRFLDGSWDTFKGQVYKDYNKNTHVIKPFKIPDHWPRFISLDYGARNPTSVHWTAVDEQGNVYCYREFYEGESTVDKNGPEIRRLCDLDGNNLKKDAHGNYYIYADRTTFNKIEDVSVADRYEKHGITLLPANAGHLNNVLAGIEVVKSYLRPDPNHEHPITKKLGAPRFYIFEGECPALEMEFPAYEYVERKTGEEKNLREEPKKYNDHAMDDIRYNLSIINDQKSEVKKVENSLDPHGRIAVNAFTEDKRDDAPFDPFEE